MQKRQCQCYPVLVHFPFPNSKCLNIISDVFCSSLSPFMLVSGHNGVNHGIEFYEDVIEYAHDRLRYRKKFTDSIDQLSFCEPKCVCKSFLDFLKMPIDFADFLLKDVSIVHGQA